MAESSSPALAPDQRIGSYVLMSRIGAGGLGEVWKARDRRLNRVVALKFISKVRHGSTPARDLLREGRAASALSHPNIITIFEVVEDPDCTYLAMEFVEGETLRQRLARGPLPMDEAFEIATQMASGMAMAHRQGIVHRDLKPDNIMLRADGIVKLVDFGLAKALPGSDASTQDQAGGSLPSAEGHVVGTFTYMAPEQARGHGATSSSDVFALGIILFEIFTGEHPFRSDTPMATLGAILHKEAPPAREKKPQVSAEVSELLVRALKKDPGLRYASAVELLDPLKHARQNSQSGETLRAALYPSGLAATEPAVAAPAAPATATAATTPEPSAASAPLRLPRWLQIIIGALLAVLLIVSGWMIGSPRRSGAETARVQSVAVITFRAPPEDQSASALAQGLADELSSAMGTAGLAVASRSAVLEISGVTDPKEIGNRLGVDAVLEGTVRSYGGKFKIHAELVSTRTSFQIWSGTVTAESADILGGEQQAANEIAKQIRTALAAARAVQP